MIKKKHKIIFLIFTVLFLSFIGLYGFYYKNRDKMCFSKHLLDAIDVNKNRTSYYSDNSRGLSEIVSKELIKNERTLLPLALLVDWRAQRFLKNNIDIVCGDFVDMNNIKPEERPPEYKKTASEVAFISLEKKFSEQKKQMEISIKKKNYKDISERASSLLKFIEKIEIEEQSSFCMSKHVVESLGYGALHASRNSELSKGGADSLLSQFIGIEIKGLSNTPLIIDKNAQRIHELGLGIVCNDVPKIPFLDE